jgi:hypothetical protein
MRMAAFRKDKGLVDNWGQMLKDHALLRLVLETLEEEHPARMAINGDNDGDISPTRASIELGTTRGYSLYADRLKMMAKPMITPQDMPETSYEDPEIQPS